MIPLALFQSLGVWEILIIVLAAILLFGSAKIPALMKTLARSQTDYKKAKRDAEREMADEDALLDRARELGIPTAGRPLDEVRKDVEARSTRP